MNKLKLIFTKDGLNYQITHHKNIMREVSYLADEDSPRDFIFQSLDEVLTNNTFSEMTITSAINHFTIMPDGFSKHDMAYDLIAYNSSVDKEQEELMLSVNKKFGIQFYYTIPKSYYQRIKSCDLPVNFNFSGEDFLNQIQVKNKKEIHINLYHSQCEFFAIDSKKVILYNNLDVNSDVDFLYFIMFTLSKIGFGRNDTYFYVYGETKENETFISELKKFVKNLKIVLSNDRHQHVILNSK